MSAGGSPGTNLWTDAAWARDYLDRRRDGIPQREQGYETLLSFLPDPTGRVLDLGTGDGQVVALVRRRFPGARCVACDFSAEMLRRARERFDDDDHVTVLEHDLTQSLPESWGAFDAVVSAFAVHHLDDERKRALYAEAFEHLAPGGVFYDLDHVRSATPELHLAWLAALGRTVDEDDPSDQLAPLDVQLRWLRELGFEQVDCHWKWRELALFGGVKPDTA